MLLAGTARTNINPYWGVELTGWGYYIKRQWQHVHDDLHATAVAVERSDGAALLVSLDLMIACYSNGRIGYLPDAHDIAAKSYAGYQSPKYCNQFPFVDESGPAMCEAMLSVISRC